jgi:hypothetical protein
MDHITKPVSGMDAAVKPDTPVSVPARGHGLAANLETGSASPLVPVATPNGGKASDAWWAHIKALDHYDPVYPYDPNHVYGPDWTDDDAYGKDGVHFMAGPAHQTSINGCHDEAQRRLGLDRVFRERCLKLPDLGVPRTNRYARNGQIIPDVFIQEHPRPGEDEHEVAYDPDNPILFVLEALSRSTFHRDLEPKVEIYRALGVREYWRYDPKRVYRTGNEPLLWGLRLSANGEYENIEPLRMAGGLPVYRSDTLGEFRMLDEGGNIHTLQTWDATRGVWLDPARARDLDAGQSATRAAFIAQLRLQIAQGKLETQAADTLAEAWERARWVPDPADVLNVLVGSSDWSTLLPSGDSRT